MTKKPTPEQYPKQRYRMALAYDGTQYSGWQTQPRRRTVQGELERVLHELTGEVERIQCSGRTDAGVHAREQVTHFDLAKPVVLKKLQLGFNALLDGGIRILSIRRALPDFHARFDATGKEYRFFIWNGEIMPPFLRNYRALVRAPLNIAAMNQAANRLVGRHDFAAFSANPHYERDGTVRHLRELKVIRRGRDIVIVAKGDGFLYRMVRSLAGFLIRVGAGDLNPEAAHEILTSKIRTARVPTAAPQGLFLWRVRYSRLISK
jgi:tRNA pseudouridine38-40 synthase